MRLTTDHHYYHTPPLPTPLTFFPYRLNHDTQADTHTHTTMKGVREGGGRHTSPFHPTTHSYSFVLHPPPSPIFTPTRTAISGAPGCMFRVASPWQLNTCLNVLLGSTTLAPCHPTTPTLPCHLGY